MSRPLRRFNGDTKPGANARQNAGKGRRLKLEYVIGPLSHSILYLHAVKPAERNRRQHVAFRP